MGFRCIRVVPSVLFPRLWKASILMVLNTCPELCLLSLQPGSSPGNGRGRGRGRGRGGFRAALAARPSAISDYTSTRRSRGGGHLMTIFEAFDFRAAQAAGGGGVRGALSKGVFGVRKQRLLSLPEEAFGHHLQQLRLLHSVDGDFLGGGLLPLPKPPLPLFRTDRETLEPRVLAQPGAVY